MVTSGATGLRTKAWDFSTYYYDLNAWLPKNMIFVNERAWRGLTDAEREAVQKAAAAAEVGGLAMSKEVAGSSRQDMASNGMKMSAGSPGQVAAQKKIGEQLAEAWQKRATAGRPPIMKSKQR